MRKLAFALQVFCLMAFIPATMILEMNHTNGQSIEQGAPAEKSKNEMIITDSPDEKTEQQAFSIPLETILLIKSF